MTALQNWLGRFKKPRWYVTLSQALLGNNLHYLAYRFRYLFVNNVFATAVHLCEFYLLSLYFHNRFLFSLILLRALTFIVKNAWWGALEGLREQVRRYSRLTQQQYITRDISCWFYGALCFAAVILVVGLWGLTHDFYDNSHQASARFFFYGGAMLVQLAADLVTRVIHSGMFATQRIYRPWWSIPFSEGLGFVTILMLLPIARAWCLPASYIVSSLSALYLTWHYSLQAYRLHDRPFLTPVSGSDIYAWWRDLPAQRIALAALGGAAMSFEGVCLWALQPLISTDPMLFKLFYLLNPQVSASFQWARLCYFDFRKLQAPKWALFTPRFHRYFLPFSLLIAVFFWGLAYLSARLFLPEIPSLFLSALLPFFAGLSLLALCQIRLFAKQYYVTLILSATCLVSIILCGYYVWPDQLVVYLCAAIGSAIAIACFPYGQAQPIFPVIRLTPIYRHLETIKNRTAPLQILYLTIAKHINSQQRRALLENISARVGQGQLSLIAGTHILISIVDGAALTPLQNLSRGCVDYYQDSGWQMNGKTALQRAYFLKKKLFYRNEDHLSLSLFALKEKFLLHFPDAHIFPLTPSFHAHCKAQWQNPQLCTQWVRAIGEEYASANTVIRLQQYFALIYRDHNGEHVFLAQASKETLSLIKYWQRHFWQSRLAYCSED